MVETGGKVHQLATARFYIKPALGKIVIRKSGVNRQSQAVLAKNRTFADAMRGAAGCPATSGGVPWKQFIANLRACASSKGLGDGSSKSREYRMRFNKYVKAPKVAATA